MSYATERFGCYIAIADHYSILDSYKELTSANSNPEDASPDITLFSFFNILLEARGQKKKKIINVVIQISPLG